MRRAVMVVITAAAAAALLAGCVPLPFLPQPPSQPQPQAPLTSEAPAGWETFEPCDTSDAWVWVDGFPAAQFEAAGLTPECGGTYVDPDLPTYTSVADRSVTIGQLDELRSLLEADGYAETASTFEAPGPATEPGLVGTWQLERNLDDPDAYEVIYIVNFWRGGDPDALESFLDYESPGTRALQP
jgi:hypothetical protein